MTKKVLLKIDKGIRPLIEQLWRHGYKTTWSCDGHKGREEAYVAFERSGDGWFEKYAKSFGLRKVTNRICCQIYLGLEDFRFCETCGSGVNRHIAYVGKLKIPKQPI